MSGRYFLLIPALFVDGLQALLSLGLAGVFTTLGGLLNLIPIVGSVLAAGVTPTGILIGFALNFVIAATFGAALMTFLSVSGAFYPRYLAWGGGELIPGLNNLPFWTLFTLLCILQKNREEGGRDTVVARGTSFTAASTRGAMRTKEEAVFPGMREAHARMGQQQYRTFQPQTGEDSVRSARSRQPLQDIRPAKVHA